MDKETEFRYDRHVSKRCKSSKGEKHRTDGEMFGWNGATPVRIRMMMQKR